MRSQCQAPSPAPHHAHGTRNKMGCHRRRAATGGPHTIPCSQAEQDSNGEANGPTQNAPLIFNI